MGKKVRRVDRDHEDKRTRKGPCCAGVNKQGPFSHVRLGPGFFCGPASATGLPEGTPRTGDENFRLDQVKIQKLVCVKVIDQGQRGCVIIC